ncbi:MAG TPA: globin [Aggregatilineales bacterium]|nr:globin [Anaerolineales bacterium]HRE47167.1 globin [Aggregatilineales bacterium]
MSDRRAETIYDLIGEDGFTRLLAGFYRRVAADALLRPLYPEDDLAPAERRLRLFLIQYFGGAPTYSAERGHPRLRMRHMPYAIGMAERDAWVRAMLAALDEAAIPEPAYSEMKHYFEDGATFLINAPSYGEGVG